MYKLITKKKLGIGMAFERLRRFEKKVNEASQQKKNDKPAVKEAVETKPVPETPVVESVPESVVEQMEIPTEPVVENQVEERPSKRNKRRNIEQNIDNNELSNNLSIIAENNNTNTENNE